MKTSVIIPTFNRAATLPRAINSLLRQRDAAELDILVIDDGSTDETPLLLADLMREHAEIRMLRQPNTGVAGARNAGLAHLLPETEFVTFLDSDDISPPGRFAADLPRLRAAPGVALSYGRMMLVDAIDPETLLPTSTAKRAEIVGIHLSCAIFRRALIERIGSFDLTLRQAEDTDYLLRVFESGAEFSQTETLCVYYLRHRDNMTRNTEEAIRYFALAVLKSIRRRRADPGIVLHKPDFALKSLVEIGYF